ncbi:uncharacterized protein [Panulirus ornatus]|uniref:uncharacterized protein n=1 Tax=Panulirus ornatus TaxID=150431 RepID=UPI003A88E5E3
MTPCCLLDLLVPLLLLSGRSSVLAAEEAPLVAVYAVRGQTAHLPCNLTTEPEDPVILLLWYKNGTKTPVFSMDSRAHGQQEWGDGTHFADVSGRSIHAIVTSRRNTLAPDVFRGATHSADVSTGSIQAADVFRGSTRTADVFKGRASLQKWQWSWSLLLREVEFSDQGEYRCRLDFQSSPTHNARVLLHVVDLPRQLSIYSAGGALVEGAASVKEGYPLTLTCRATGGEPQPNVTWWSGSALLDSEADDHQDRTTPSASSTVSPAAAPYVTNTLHVAALTRAHISQNLTCTAANTPALPPLRASVHLQETDTQVTVNLTMPRDQLLGGRQYDVKCHGSGVKPPPVLTWWLRSERLSQDTQEKIVGANTTVSVLQLRVDAGDDGGVLECRAASPTLPHLTGIASTRLTVHYVPEASISIEGVISLDRVGGQEGGLRAGDSATLTCAAHANPPAYNFTFLFNGRPLHRANVVESGPSLTLVQLDHRDVGLYTCIASNSAGDGQSNAVALHIDYAPVCEWEGARKVLAAVGEKVEMECRVRASPPVVTYTWESVTFTPNMEQVRAPLHHKDIGLKSVGWAVADNSSSGGQRAECQPTSEIGPADHPCVFTILIIEEPSPLIGCRYHDVTTDSAGVTCSPVMTSGHLPLTYYIEVREGGKLIAAYNSSIPSFNLTSLAPGRDYVLTMHASHSKGSGLLTTLLMKTLTPRAEEVAPERVSVNSVNSPGEVPEPPTEPPTTSEDTPVSVVVAGVVVGVVVGVAVVVAGVVACRAHRAHAYSPGKTHQHHNSSQDSLIELPPGVMYQSYSSHPSCELLTTFSPGPVVVTQVTPGRSGRRSLPLSRRSSTRSAPGGRSPRPIRPRAFSCRGGPVHVVEVEADDVTTPRVEIHSPSRLARLGLRGDPFRFHDSSLLSLRCDPMHRPEPKGEARRVPKGATKASSQLQLTPHVHLSPQSFTSSQPHLSSQLLDVADQHHLHPQVHTVNLPYTIPQIQITPQPHHTATLTQTVSPPVTTPQPHSADLPRTSSQSYIPTLLLPSPHQHAATPPHTDSSSDTSPSSQVIILPPTTDIPDTVTTSANLRYTGTATHTISTPPHTGALPSPGSHNDLALHPQHHSLHPSHLPPQIISTPQSKLSPRQPMAQPGGDQPPKKPPRIHSTTTQPRPETPTIHCTSPERDSIKLYPTFRWFDCSLN